MAVLLVMAIMATVGIAPADAQTTRPGDTATAESQFLQLLNAERQRAGRGPLAWDHNLTNDARSWSKVMAGQNRIFHTSTLSTDTARSVPDWQRAGENVGMGFGIDSLHSAFVKSSGHYNNMIGDFTRVGIGVVYTHDRTFVTVRFAKSPTAPGVSPLAAAAPGQVRRLYLAFFKREPDSGGSAFWVDKLANGYPLGQVSAEFVKSSEFRSTYGHLDNAGFISMVYQNVLGRQPDASGYTYWSQRMAQGMGRGSVMVNFSESAEFRAATS